MASDLSKLTENVRWQDLTLGCTITGSQTSRAFPTGEWRVTAPYYLNDKCRQCLLCVPVCPDSSIPVAGGRRGGFDLEHCKGCGICAKVCPFGAITWNSEDS